MVCVLIVFALISVSARPSARRRRPLPERYNASLSFDPMMLVDLGEEDPDTRDEEVNTNKARVLGFKRANAHDGPEIGSVMAFKRAAEEDEEEPKFQRKKSAERSGRRGRRGARTRRKRYREDTEDSTDRDTDKDTDSDFVEMDAEPRIKKKRTKNESRRRKVDDDSEEPRARGSGRPRQRRSTRQDVNRIKMLYDNLVEEETKRKSGGITRINRERPTFNDQNSLKGRKGMGKIKLDGSGSDKKETSGTKEPDFNDEKTNKDAESSFGRAFDEEPPASRDKKNRTDRRKASKRAEYS